MKIVIEKNVPEPIGKQNYPFQEMSLGDSFKIPYTKKAYYNLAGQASYFRSRYEKTWKFKIRCVKSEDIIRIWRIK